MIHEAIYNLLKGVDADCYPGAVEQVVKPPFIAHRQLSMTPNPTKSGKSKHDWIYYQVGYWAEKKSDVETLAASGRTALDEYSGTINGHVIVKIRITDQKTDFDEASNLYAVIQNYKIWVKT